jgi:hypothetical protein
MLTDPLDLPGRRLDPVTESLLGRLHTTVPDLLFTWKLCDQIERALSWRQVICNWRAAKAYPAPSEFWRHTEVVSRRHRVRLQVAYAITIRAQVRWAPLYQNLAHRYFGRVQLTPAEQSSLSTLSEWVDLWIDRNGLRVNYLGGHLYVLASQSGVRVGVCETALQVGGKRAGFNLPVVPATVYDREPVLTHLTEGPVLLSAQAWAQLQGSGIDGYLWRKSIAQLGGRPLTTPISQAEFAARQSPSLVRIA